jgi:hypothetical protein
MNQQPARPSYPGFFGILVKPLAYNTLHYMLFAAISGPFIFAWVALGLALSLPLAMAGIPLFALFMASVRLLGGIESRMIEKLLGVPIPRARTPPAQAMLRDRTRAALRDPLGWSAIAYLLLRLPLGLLYFALAAFCLLLPSAFLWAGAWIVSGQVRLYPPDPTDDPLWRQLLSGRILHETAGTMHLHGAPEWLAPWLQTPVAAGAMVILAGILLFLPLLHLIRAVGEGHAKLAERLLAPLPARATARLHRGRCRS